MAGGWGAVSALKVTLSCKLGQPGELIIGADKPGPVCTSCSPPGGAGAQGEDERPEASHRVAPGRPACCAAQAGDSAPFTVSSPHQRAGREGGSPSPSWDVPASPSQGLPFPAWARGCWGQCEASRRGKKLGGLGHVVGTGLQPHAR